MNRVFIICYLVFFAGFVIPLGTSSDLEEGYPPWMTISGVIIPSLGAISILLYALSYQRKRCAWLWKIVPFMLVAYYAFSWYFDFALYSKPDDHPLLVTITTVICLLLLYPAFYFSFKFGYSEDSL